MRGRRDTRLTGRGPEPSTVRVTSHDVRPRVRGKWHERGRVFGHPVHLVDRPRMADGNEGGAGEVVATLAAEDQVTVSADLLT